MGAGQNLRAQHGTSGNSYERLKEIAKKTHTTKANVATALQMVSWGLKVNEYGNAIQDKNGDFIKMPDVGMSDEIWNEMVAYAGEKGWKGGNYKWLNLPFENKLLGRPREERERMIQAVEEFVHNMIVNVFNSGDTAPLAIDEILRAGSYDLGPKASRIEDPQEWTEERILKRAEKLTRDKGPEGDFAD